MKPSILLVYSWTLVFAMPALAMDGNSCVAQSTQLELSERDAYMKSCMAQVGSPDNVKKTELQQKKALCEQNAKNHKLHGNDKDSYFETCMNKNEAEAAAKGITTKATAKVEDGQKETKKNTAKSAPAKDRAGAKAKPKAKPKAESKPKTKAAREATK